MMVLLAGAVCVMQTYATCLLPEDESEPRIRFRK